MVGERRRDGAWKTQDSQGRDGGSGTDVSIGEIRSREISPIDRARLR
jgi:hypothetical protein